jgi:hypothetical protein
MANAGGPTWFDPNDLISVDLLRANCDDQPFSDEVFMTPEPSTDRALQASMALTGETSKSCKLNVAKCESLESRANAPRPTTNGIPNQVRSTIAIAALIQSYDKSVQK